MKKIIKSLLLFAAISAGAGFVASCSDDDDMTQSRLFRPVISENNIETGVDANLEPYITFSWDNYTSANQYVITLQPEDGGETLTQAVDTTMVTFSKLAYDVNYNISIKATNTVTGKESKEYTFAVRSADYPTRLQPLASTDIIDIQCRVSWDKQDGATQYDSLSVFTQSDDELVSTRVLTEEDLAAGNVIIGGLEPSKSYYVKAFQGAAYKGKRAFKTTASEKYEGAVVDLRNLSEEESFKAITSDSIASWVEQYPDQNITVVLNGGVKYRMPGLKVPATTGVLKFVTGLTLRGNAELRVEGNFNLDEGINIGGLAFDKIFFTESDSKKKTDGNYGATYIMNLSASDANIGSISFNACTIKYKRGIVRTQKNNVIDNLTINDCVIDSIAGYGILCIDGGSSACKNINVTNSTFSNVELFLRNNKGEDPTNVNVANCTFVYCIDGSKQMFMFKNPLAGDFTFKNSIIGQPGKTTANPSTTFAAHGGKAIPNTSDIYFTNDVIWKPVSEEDASPAAAIDGKTLNKSTAEVFRAPLISDFTLIFQDLKLAKAGDPRWY